MSSLVRVPGGNVATTASKSATVGCAAVTGRTVTSTSPSGSATRLIEIDVPATKPPPNDHSAIHATKVAGSGCAGQRWVSFPSRAIRPYLCASYAFFNWSSDGGYTSNQSNPYTLSRNSFSVDQALADLRCTRATSNVDAEGFPREGLLKDALAQVAASHTPSRRRRASTWRPPART